ncbi:MAG: InlB B-repeat-containing protein, partial [Clostridiales bacterium]|nr:InlB B-repeat-containing protein [Clostridiales bacterium]
HARAFEECSSLKEVILDVSVKVIDENAFKNCPSLNKIHIYGSCPSISQTAFTNDAAHVYITKSFLAARDGDDRLPHINDPHGYWYFGAKILSYQMINTLVDERKTVYIDQTPRGTVKLYNYTSFGGYINWIEFSSSGSLWKGEIVEIINMDTGKAVKPSDINMEHLTYIEKIPGYSRTELYSFEMPSYNVKFKIKFDENPAESDYIGLDPAVPLPEREGQPWNIAADGTAKLQATLVDGTLLISSKVPRGHTIEMADFASGDAPWYSEKDSIRRIVIEEGVTNIGSCAFLNCKSIESVFLPSTLTKIGRDAFAYSSVSHIDMPKSLNEIGKSAFYRCNLDVNFRSKPESMHANAFENASVCCYVDEAWLGVATVDELNDKSGKYQYGGDVKYVAVSGDEYSITVIQAEGGTVKSHYDKARQNTLVMLDVEPAPGYGFDRFTTTGTFVYYGDTSFVMPKNDVTLTPVFKKLTHYLWCYHVDGVSLDCEKIYWNYGDKVKINSHAEPGYKLVEYLVKEADGERTVPVSDDGTFIMPDFDVHIFGESEKIGYTVTVKQAPEGFAFVNGGMGYDGEQFTAYVDDKITLDTIAVPHKKLKKWIIQTADGSEEMTSDVFDMPASDVTITPVFDTDYKINVASGDGGKVECNTDYAFAGDTVTLTVISDPGYTFAGFEEKPAGLEIADDGSFVMPKGDVSLKAKFERNGYAITSGDDGKGALIIANTANYNEKVTFDASPFYGYAVSKVSVRKTDGSAVKVIGNSFTMPDCDIYVSAEFENVKHKVLLHVSGEEYGSATLTDVIAGVGDKVRFTVSTNTDCGAYMEISPWADISFDSGVYSFEMPPIETDIIINFYKIDGSQTYPWYVGDETPENVKAYIDGGTLIITGNGTEKMKNFPASGAPWTERAGEITGAQMTSVINVGDYAFAGLSLSDELTLDENVKTVGKCAFERCALRGGIAFTGKPEKIEPDAFEGVSASVSVGRIWIYGGLTEGDLNKADGDYKFGGKLTYKVRQGEAKITLTVVPGADSQKHGTVSVSAGASEQTGVYYADNGEKIYVYCAPDTGYEPHVTAYYENGGRHDIDVTDSALVVPAANELVSGMTGEVRFEEKKYAVTFDMGGRAANKGVQASYTDLIVIPSGTDVTGYDIEGWYTDTSYENKWNFASDKMPCHDITLYAKFVPKTYIIIWKDDAGNVLATHTDVPYGTLPSFGQIPVKNDGTQNVYVFTGWTPEPSVVNSNAEYTASFKISELPVVIFDLNGHGTSAPATKETAPGGKITEPQTPTDTDYAFGGWYKDKGCTDAWHFDTDTVSASVILYAKWEIKTYKIVWKNYDGTVLFSDEAVPAGTLPRYNGSTPIKPSTAEKEYTFTGWDTEPSLASKNAEYTAVFSDTTRSYTVVFECGGKGTKPSDQSVKVGELISDPGALTETGYVFGGWYSDSSCIDESRFDFAIDTMPAKPFTLYAKWNVISYEITWQNYDLSELETTS